jgi:hypothetical protein
MASPALPAGAAGAAGQERHAAPRRPPRAVEDGAASPKAVFDRARKAFGEKDYETVFHTIAPGTRRRWLGAMVFSSEFASMARTSAEGERRFALTALRESLDRFGASLSVEERLAGLTLEEMDAALMGKVGDPAGLFAELVGWAGKQGAATDPMQALSEPGVLVAPTDPGSLFPPPDGGTPRASVDGPNGIAAVLRRLADGAPLGPVKVTRETATASLKRDGGALPGDVQRFLKQGAMWFLEE